ncbi:TIGR00366 family protein [Geodermatophilus sp. YIM 151500]|uniref:short-chain fatty acid transporter n=1 Tax=Geodermatophilus sp. YIM 151500 TaxID=2984531 RepID=UPI0021E41348|nr:TIGR00366 family protein [Geodermatophilus sp. YIM 151500]MCV2488376.1 TIGR00366 family protein [Geodermatophilus sp. YIM 151500]
MLRALSRPMVTLVERYMPNSLVFAVILTFVVAGLALGLTDAGPVDVVRAWGDGLAGLLAFMTQIALVLLFGYTLAHTPPVHRFLVRVAGLPRSPKAAYAFVALVAGIASLISWGLGLIVGGILAIEIGRSARRRGVRVHYPLLVASAYSGFVVWHMGYSGSGPLAAATEGSFFAEEFGVVPVTETTFSTWNMIATVLTLAAVAGAMVLMAPRSEDPVVELPDDAVEADEDEHEGPAGDPSQGGAPVPADVGPTAKPAATLADRIDGARAVTLSIGVALLVYLAVYFVQEGFNLTLDIVNWTFLAAILLVVKSPRELGTLVADAGRTVGEVLIQYPLYAGILGMTTATGLAAVISDFFVSIATPGTLGLWAFLAAGLLNMFVPSGGGQFAVQAPIFMGSAESLGVDAAPIIMAISYGDQWTNMIQPFWTLPLLAVARLGVRDILGYTIITLVVSGIIFAGTLLVVGAG